MNGLFFYTQIAFAVVLFWATAATLYMGVFHAHRHGVAWARKAMAGFCSSVVSMTMWFFMYSWTYLGW